MTFSKQRSNNNGLCSAAANGNVLELSRIWERIPPEEYLDRINAYNRHGFTPLHGASFHGNLEAIEFLLKNGANVSLPAAREQWTFALHLAAIHGGTKIIRVLLNAGADPFLCDWDGATPLDVAVRANNKPVVTFLSSQMDIRRGNPLNLLPNWTNFDNKVLDIYWRRRSLYWPRQGQPGGTLPIIYDHYSDGGSPPSLLLAKKNHPGRLYRTNSQPITSFEHSGVKAYHHNASSSLR